MKKLVFLAVLVLFFLPVLTFASAPIVGGSGKTLPGKWWYIESHSIVMNFDEAWSNNRWVKLPDSKEVFIHLNLSQVYFGVSDRFNLRLNVPFYWTLANGQNNLHYLLGDIILDSKFRFYQVNNKFFFSLIPGISFATGDKRLRPFDSDESPLDFSGGYNLTTEFSRFGFHHYLLYCLKTQNIPDYLQYNFAFDFTATHQLDLCFELNGKHWMGSLDGKRSLDLCAGIQFYPVGKTPCFEASIMFPINNIGGLRYKGSPGIYAGFGYFWGK